MLKFLVVLLLAYVIFTNFADIKTYFQGQDLSIESTTESFQKLRYSAEEKYQQLQDTKKEVKEAKQAIDNLME